MFVRADVATGAADVCLSRSPTPLFRAGMNDEGQLLPTGEHSDEQILSQPTLVEPLSTHRITQASVGEHHVAVVTSSQIPLAMGSNEHSALGHSEARDEPYRVPPRMMRGLGAVKVVQVSCGYTHTVVLTRNGEVFTCGSGVRGALGHGDREDGGKEARRVMGLAGVPITQVAAGDNFTLAVAATGLAYSWGSNKSGQLGLQLSKYPHDVLSPVRVDGMPELVQLAAAGESHSAWVSRSGRLYTAGRNGHGQLGLGFQQATSMDEQQQDGGGGSATSISSSAAGGDHARSSSASSSIWCVDQPTLVNVPGQRRVREVACASRHTLVLCVDSCVFAMGDCSEGSTGIHLDRAGLVEQWRARSARSMLDAEKAMAGDSSTAGAGKRDAYEPSSVADLNAGLAPVAKTVSDVDTSIVGGAGGVDDAATTDTSMADAASTEPDVPCLDLQWARDACLWGPTCVPSLSKIGVFRVAAGGDHSLAIRVTYGSVLSTQPGSLPRGVMIFIDCATMAIVARLAAQSANYSILKGVIRDVLAHSCNVNGSFLVGDGAVLVQTMAKMQHAGAPSSMSGGRRASAGAADRLSSAAGSSAAGAGAWPASAEGFAPSAAQQDAVVDDGASSTPSDGHGMVTDGAMSPAIAGQHPMVLHASAASASMAPSAQERQVQQDEAAHDGGGGDPSAVVAAAAVSSASSPMPEHEAKRAHMEIDSDSAGDGAGSNAVVEPPSLPPLRISDRPSMPSRSTSPSASTAASAAARVPGGVEDQDVDEYGQMELGTPLEASAEPLTPGHVPRTPLGLPSSASVQMAPVLAGPMAPSSIFTLSSGLDVPGLEQAYTSIMQTYDTEVIAELVRAGASLMDELEAAAPTVAHPDALRAYIALWMAPVNLKPSFTAATVARMCSAILTMPQLSRDMLFKWIGSDAPGVLFGSRLIKPLQEHLSYHARLYGAGLDGVVYDYRAHQQQQQQQLSSSASGSSSSGSASRSSSSSTSSSIKPRKAITHLTASEYIIRVLRLCYQLNERLAKEAQAAVDDAGTSTAAGVSNAASSVAAKGLELSSAPLGALVPAEAFYNSTLSDLPDRTLKDDYSRWKAAGYQRTVTTPIAVCGYPFLLNAAAKRRIIGFETTQQMQTEASSAMMRSLFGGFMGGGGGLGGAAGGGPGSESPYLVLQVRRSHLLSDALNRLVGLPVSSLRKQLKVVFADEEGIDQGGVTKEFFQLVVKQVFDDRYGMWTYSNETRTHWFNPAAPPESEREYLLIGVLLGLAIYNGILLDVHFPQALYKKLLGMQVGLHDLRTVNPSLASGLQKLVEYRGADVEDVFCLDWTATYEAFGEPVQADLVDKGADTPVTSDNKLDYVKAYCDWALTKSCEVAFAEFRRGFGMVMSEHTLNLLRPEELELLIAGTPHLDFAELEKVCKYEGGYHADHRTIKSFWRVVKGLNDEHKTKLLLFVTGSAKAPIGGLGKLPFMVQRMGPDSNMLPTASTCFNMLLLPDYSSEAKLKDRLVTAISECAGFGLK